MVIYATAVLSIAAAASVVQARAAFLIRELHPSFPRMVELAFYTPDIPYMVAHNLGIPGMVVLSAIFAGASSG